MEIYGLQKLTLLDYPGQVACTLFTGGCNFRCPFCHNSPLVLENAQSSPIPLQEVESFLQKRRKLLDGVCISGGEPLLQSGLEDFLSYIKSLGYKIKLDTNGSLPARLEALLSAGLLDFVAMDIKNALPHYAETIGLPLVDIAAIQRSISLLRECGLPHEFRTTIVKGYHDPARISELTQMIAGEENYFLQNFVDSGQLIDPSVRGCSREEMEEMLAAARKHVPGAELRGI
ncbi:MAG: anaerobic ribonucleoside-triphosphate reductase activating protein [Bacillota bacterium]|nr:anaerobic ribonucleoside-triphosphate reductase activating protein [Bacillota bacterium]